jgi:hypothetical protein
MKAVIQYLLLDTPADDFSGGLVDLGYDVISVKEMTTARRSPEVITTTYLHLLFILFKKKHLKKSSNRFCHISIV